MTVDILIVDDDREFGEFVKHAAESVDLSAELLLEPRGFEEAFLSLQPRIVILDLEMPNIDGAEISQWLGKRVRDTKQDCRLIIVSGQSVEKIAIAKAVAELSGLERVAGLSKPVTLATLELELAGGVD